MTNAEHTARAKFRESLRDSQRAVVLVVGVLVLLLALRCVWAALIASGVIQAIDGVPTLLSSEPSVYDMVLFTLTELLPSAVLLWGIRARADATSASEDARQADQRNQLAAARLTGGYQAPALIQWAESGEGACPDALASTDQPGGYGAMGTLRQPSLIPVARLESTDDATRMGGRAAGLAFAASGRHAPHEWASTSDAGGAADSAVGVESLTDVDESLVGATHPSSASRHQFMEGAQRGPVAAGVTPGRGGLRAGLLSPDSDFRSSAGGVGARGGIGALGTPKQLFLASDSSPRRTPDR